MGRKRLYDPKFDSGAVIVCRWRRLSPRIVHCECDTGVERKAGIDPGIYPMIVLGL